MSATCRLHLLDVVSRLLASRLFQRRFGFDDLRQPSLAALQFVGNVVVRQIAELLIIGRVRAVGACQQGVDLLLQSFGFRPHAVVTHRLVTRRIRLDFGAVQRQTPHLQQARFATQHQHFQKQRLQMLQMPGPILGDAAKVGDVLADNHPKGRVGDTALHDLSRREHADTIRIEQQHEHHSRVKRRLPAVLTTVIVDDRREIHLTGDIQQKINQMLLGQPIPRRRRKQPPRIRLPIAKLTTHP